MLAPMSTSVPARTTEGCHRIRYCGRLYGGLAAGNLAHMREERDGTPPPQPAPEDVAKPVCSPIPTAGLSYSCAIASTWCELSESALKSLA